MEAGDEKGRRRRISNCGGEGALFLEGKMAHTARPSSPFIYYAAESRRERKKVRVPLLNFPSPNRRHRLVMATEEKGEGEHFPKFVRRKKYIFGLNVARAAWISPQSWTTLKKGKEKRRRFSRWSRKKHFFVWENERQASCCQAKNFKVTFHASFVPQTGALLFRRLPSFSIAEREERQKTFPSPLLTLNSVGEWGWG